MSLELSVSIHAPKLNENIRIWYRDQVCQFFWLGDPKGLSLSRNEEEFQPSDSHMDFPSSK
jgi:hypothetical protein